MRAAIEDVARTRPHISQQEYLDLYGRILEPDRDKALHLSRYLHDLGVFLHFQEDERLSKTVSDLVLTYRYEFLPKGLVSRLMVRKHRLVAHPELCWSLDELWKVLRKLGSDPALLTVPGNHDLVRPKPKSPFVVALTQSNDPEIISDFWDNDGGTAPEAVAGRKRT